MLFVGLLVLLCANAGVFATSGGALTGACDNIKPSHGGSPQTSSENPYRISLSQTSAQSGETITVTLEKKSSSDTNFLGFMVQARDKSSGEAVGEFSNLESKTKYLTCSGKPDKSTITHNDSSGKDKIQTQWKYPAFDSGSDKQVEFRFAAVQSYSTYWANEISSTTLTVSADPDAEAESEETPESEGKAEAEAEAEAKQNLPEEYKECFDSKGCFGVPEECEVKGNCEAMVTYRQNSDDADTLSLVLYGKTSAGYLAVGFSTDQNMGEDLVLVCLPGDKMMATWNQVHEGKKTNRDIIETDFPFSVESFGTNDGLASCSFNIPKSTKVKVAEETAEREFVLGGEKNFYLLIAHGAASGEALTYHSSRRASGHKVDLTETSKLGSASNALIKAHGIIMIFAWMASASTGMFFARYMKETWKAKKVVGKDMWFRVHQLCMGLTVILTILGFILVTSEQGFEPYMNFMKNPHPVLGTVVIIFALIQPTMAMFRCHPNTQNRWIFNWAHWFIGNSAWILAIVTIFFAADLPAADFLPVTDFYIRIGIFVLVYFIYHVVMTILRCISQHHSEVDDLELTSRQPGSTSSNSGSAFAAEEEKDMRGSCYRKGIAISFALFVWIYSLAIVVLIGIAKPGKQQWT